jgi:hypothetical protein
MITKRLRGAGRVASIWQQVFWLAELGCRSAHEDVGICMLFIDADRFIRLHSDPLYVRDQYQHYKYTILYLSLISIYSMKCRLQAPLNYIW